VVAYPTLADLRGRRRLAREAEELGHAIEYPGEAMSFAGTGSVPGVGIGGGDMGEPLPPTSSLLRNATHLDLFIYLLGIKDMYRLVRRLSSPPTPSRPLTHCILSRKG